jgi:hypothetical protein
VQDTLVSATCDAYCGLAIRGGGIFFTELSVIPFSEAGIRIESTITLCSLYAEGDFL